jgi:hypothetical protein
MVPTAITLLEMIETAAKICHAADRDRSIDEKISFFPERSTINTINPRRYRI